jgi:hypothetical protein
MQIFRLLFVLLCAAVASIWAQGTTQIGGTAQSRIVLRFDRNPVDLVYLAGMATRSLFSATDVSRKYITNTLGTLKNA